MSDASLALSGRPIVGVSHPPAETKDSASEVAGPDAPTAVEYLKETVPDRIAITSRRKIVFVDLADVVAVEARCNYVVLRTLSGAHALRQPISAIAEGIERHGFVRIHRSTIVNGRFVEEIRTSASGKMFVQLKGLSSEYDVSRKYRSALRLFASRWRYGATMS